MITPHELAKIRVWADKNAAPLDIHRLLVEYQDLRAALDSTIEALNHSSICNCDSYGTIPPSPHQFWCRHRINQEALERLWKLGVNE
jgi:hypothetical protein